MNFREELKSKTAAVEKIVESYLPEESGTQHEIMEAMNYSVTAGGKRLRPLLMHETYRMFGGTGRVIQRRQGSGAVHGSYGDDPHLFSGA